MIWTWTEKGKRMPIDAEPDPNGRIEIVEREHRPNPEDDPAPLIRVQVGDEQTLPGFGAPERYTSHFATCPNAKKHRKR